MKYFHHHPVDDVNIWFARCHFEAKHGHPQLALARVRELAEEFPENPHVAYEHGLMLRDLAGRGLEAREQFIRAYDLAAVTGERGTQWFAVCNITAYALNEQDLRLWAGRGLSLAPLIHEDRQTFKAKIAALDAGVTVCEQQKELRKAFAGRGAWGELAALLAVTLQAPTGSATDEAFLRQERAEALRALDRAAHAQREALVEAFLPDERTALHDALQEIEKAIALHPYEAVFWNSRSGWCHLLGRYAESIDYADRAIQLKPNGYPRPWINKALSLARLGRKEEALAAAQEALSQAYAGSNEYRDAVSSAQQLANDIHEMCTAPSEGTLVRIAGSIADAASGVGVEAIGMHKTSLDYLVQGVMARMMRIGRRQAISYVPMMAQFLSDFPPEVAFLVFGEILDRQRPLFGLCLFAAQYLACDAEGTQRRDAARFLALNMMAQIAADLPAARVNYRQSFLAISQVTDDPLARSAQILQDELARLHPLILPLIVDQPPLTEEELSLVRAYAWQHFTDDPHEFEMVGPHLAGDGVVSAFEPKPKVWLRSLVNRVHGAWWQIRGGPWK